MTDYYKETIENITAQLIEEEVLAEIEDIKTTGINEISKIETETLAYISDHKTTLEKTGGELIDEANDIYLGTSEYVGISVNDYYEKTCIIASDTVDEIKKMITDKGYIIVAFHDGNDDVYLLAQIGVSYTSLGDSIAAGHTIDEDWATNYGEGSQYGKNGNTQTVIVPNSYTNLIGNQFIETYGETYGKNNVSVKSFARSGDTVADLIEKLSHDVVKDALGNAAIVTVCIGANDVLQPALSQIENYINYGNPALADLAVEVEANLSVLDDDTNENSYRALIDRLYEINPNAKYIFTNIYNPLKYLWIDESTVEEDYKDGFFGPLMWAIPETIGSISNNIRGSLLGTSAVQTVYDRINGESRDGSDGLAAWTDTYVSKLNQILKNKIDDYNNPNFVTVDTKLLFESFPDRPISAEKHYNDLVSVEFTRGYVVEDMDWGQFWSNFTLSDITGSMEDTMSNIMSNVVTNVIVPDIDPHPEVYGHYVLNRSFEDALNWSSLSRYSITFNANGGAGSMAGQKVVGIGELHAFTTLNSNTFTAVEEGYHFIGWNTASDGSGEAYTNGQVISLTSDLTLYAQWSNLYTVTYKHSNHTELYGDDETGHQECYALYINGELKPKFGDFSDGSSTTYSVPYGSTIRVVVSNYNPTELTYDDVDCNVYWNGTLVSSGYRGTEYTFTLTCNVTIDFWWEIAGSLVTFDAQSWEDCYITTS